MKNQIRGIVVKLLVIIILVNSFTDSISFFSYSNISIKGINAMADTNGSSCLHDNHKIGEALEQRLAEAKADEYITVGMWVADIDCAAIKEEACQDAGISSIEYADEEAIQNYIQIKRELMAKAYRKNNKSYCSQYLAEDNVKFISSYAPYIIASVKAKNVEDMSLYGGVTSLNLYFDLQKSEEAVYSIPNIHADVTRDLRNITGFGVKVGILEMGYPNMNNNQLRDKRIFFDVPDKEAGENINAHATKVTSIIVGESAGIAPDATVYLAVSGNRLQDYNKIEWLISQGVNVINYSAGYPEFSGEYSDMAKWIDYLTFQYDITFVKSAGNCGPRGGITDPGMAYNGLTVGSINENDSDDEPDWSDDTFSDISAFVENEGGYKPDLTAPGYGISVAGFPAVNGTSFSAPHVTGVIAQILELRSDLKCSTCALNAVLKAGTAHKTADDYGKYSLMPDYSNKEGAGVIDALGAYDTAYARQYLQVELDRNSFPYTKWIAIDNTSKPIRIVINWLKQSTIVNDTLIERALTDLDLAVYRPDGTEVKISQSANNNTELVEFCPSVRGNYKIVVDGYSCENTYEVLGLSWSQPDPFEIMPTHIITPTPKIIPTPKITPIPRITLPPRITPTPVITLPPWTLPSTIAPIPTIVPSLTTTPIPIRMSGEDGLVMEAAVNDWGAEYIMDLKVMNTSDRMVEGWSLTLKKSEFSINTIWNATITESEKYFIIKPIEWNNTIPAGGAVTFGFQAYDTPVSYFYYKITADR